MTTQPLNIERAKIIRKLKSRARFRNNRILHIMLVPAVILAIIFCYIPMVGILMAFQDFNPSFGFSGFFLSQFVGFDNFTYLFNMPDFFQVVWNTLYISILKIVLGILVPVLFALLINEVKRSLIKRTIQTAIYLPHFLSWVILGGILIDILSPSEGILNVIIKAFGFDPIFFLGNAHVFPYVIVITDIWKEFGFGTIVFLASITSINPNLYEAAAIDGAGRFKQTIHITLPGMAPIILLISTISLSNILNAGGGLYVGFDQIFNLYSPIVYTTGDIIDTFVFRLGLQDLQYSPAAVAGFIKSAVSSILIITSYWLVYRIAKYRIF